MPGGTSAFDAGSPSSGMTGIYADSDVFVSETSTPSAASCIFGSINGQLSNCQDTGVTGFSAPAAMAYFKGYLYIADTVAGIHACDSPSGGSLTCTSSNSGIAQSKGLTASDEYLYVSSLEPAVYKCVLASQGSSALACSVTSVSGLDNPVYVYAKLTFLYISNTNPATGLTRCDIALDGSLSNCNQAAQFGSYSTFIIGSIPFSSS